MTLTIISAPDIGQHIAVVGGSIYYGDTPQDAIQRAQEAQKVMRARPSRLIAPADLASKFAKREVKNDR